MNIQRGTLTYTRYEAVEGGRLHGGDLLAHAFRPIDPKGQAVVSIGFCASDSAMEAPNEDLQDRLGVRIDVLKPPSDVVGRHVTHRCKKRLADTGRGKLTAAEKALIKAETVRDLRLQTLPRTTHVQVTVDGFDVRIFAAGTRAAAVAELLEKAFGPCVLRPVTPGTLAIDALGEKAGALEPSRFHL